jgi:HSP20 family protein
VFALRVSIGLSEAWQTNWSAYAGSSPAAIWEIAAMSDLLFNSSLFDELDRFQRQMSSLFSGLPSSIRASRFSSFPQINLGSTDDSVEVVAFAPGIDPAKLELTVDKGLLTISGERARVEPQSEGRSYAQERFAGAFRRAIELPRDADPDNVKARYVNGCLTISIGRRETSRPRTIAVQ